MHRLDLRSILVKTAKERGNYLMRFGLTLENPPFESVILKKTGVWCNHSIGTYSSTFDKELSDDGAKRYN
ncbi:hypothetical protein JCM17380_43520 [Desulfosporosinus burensis]